ncbi:ATP-dependent protease La [Cryptococcus sp. DSM 104549]
MAAPLIPSSLPLVPLPPPQVLYPFLRASIPLTSTQLALVLDALPHDKAEKNKDVEVRVDGQIVGVIPVAEGERRVGRWGTAAKIRSVEKSKDEKDIYLMVVEGLSRIYLPRSLPPTLSILPSIPLPTSSFSLPLASTSQSFTDLLPFAYRLLPSQLHPRLTSVPSALLPDLLATVLGLDWETKVEILGLSDVEERSNKVKELLLEMMSDRGIPPPDSVTRERKLFRPSTALIPRPRPSPLSRPRPPPDTPEIPEDLVPLHDVLKSRLAELSSTAEQTITRELARLAKLPPHSPEYGVTKTYLECLLALPWKKVDEGVPVSLDDARTKLDGDHEGLDEVKRRVVEYLAVYRLKRELFLEEKAKKAAATPIPDESDPKLNKIGPEMREHLLEMIPPSDREPLKQPTADPKKKIEDGPPDDVYRDKGPILLLVGPPGVGKTSIARSLADSLGRKFHRISLGGVRDEAEIRGHRRTYVGALPGLLVQAMRKVGVANPLILLDELDKLGTSQFHGDPSAALLEALDPAQNWNFHDHYLGEVPIDLSQVLFIATANTLQSISHPLRDRCEIIECSGYITPEKVKIAEKFLVPKQIKECGLDGKLVQFEAGVLQKVVEEYTWESGVRSLERQIGKLCRTKAVEYSAYREKGEKSTDRAYDPLVRVDDVEKILGISRHQHEDLEEVAKPGMVNGLTFDGSGNGSVLVLETLLVPGGKGNLVVTGQLGDVFRESIELCMTWVKSRAVALGITSSHNQNPLKNMDIHYHTPEGAIKKDGPSAGIGTVLAFVSLLTGRPVPTTLAVTGEMSLRGKVLRIGGVKEKTLGAHRAGMTKVILPHGNRKDVEADVPDVVKRDITFVYVATIEEAIEEVWGKSIWAEDAKERGVVGRVDARL